VRLRSLKSAGNLSLHVLELLAVPWRDSIDDAVEIIVKTQQPIDVVPFEQCDARRVGEAEMLIVVPFEYGDGIGEYGRGHVAEFVRPRVRSAAAKFPAEFVGGGPPSAPLERQGDDFVVYVNYPALLSH